MYLREGGGGGGMTDDADSRLDFGNDEREHKGKGSYFQRSQEIIADTKKLYAITSSVLS